MFDSRKRTIRRENMSMMMSTYIMPWPTRRRVRSLAKMQLGASGMMHSNRLGAGTAPRRCLVLLCGPGDSERKPSTSITVPASLSEQR